MKSSSVVPEIDHPDDGPQGEPRLSQEPESFALDVAVGQEAPADRQEGVVGSTWLGSNSSQVHRLGPTRNQIENAGKSCSYK